MRKQFSQALIVILMLVSPLSFCGDVCPDFKPACDVQSIPGKKAATTVAAMRCAATVRPRTPSTFDSLTFSSSPCTIPTTWFGLPSYGRAPPTCFS